MSYKDLTDSERSALSKCASYLGVDEGILASIIQFESRWNPKSKNQSSSARGLIQFTDGAARSVGYSDSLDLITKENTIEKQLAVPNGPVCKYFKMNSGIGSGDLFGVSMKVFYPAAVSSGMGLFDRFPSNVTAANSGIKCPFDYIKPVIKVAKQNGIQISGSDKSVQAYDELVASGKIDESKYGGDHGSYGGDDTDLVDLVKTGGGLGFMLAAMIASAKASNGGKPPSKDEVAGATAAASSHIGDVLGFIAKAA